MDAVRSARSEPARSTRLILAESVRVEPSASACRCRSMIVIIACDRDERSFIRVAATCRARLPSAMRRSTSSWFDTCTSVRSST